MNIRKLKLIDYPVIDKCMQALHELHVNGRPDLYAPLEHPYSEREFAEIICDKNRIAIGMTDEHDAVVGFCIATLRDKSGMVEGVKNIHINDLFVLEEYRGRGIAKQLFSELGLWARAMGAARLELTVWEFNAPAANLYRSLGMTPQRHILEKML